eukprot:306636-Hanusia_phi.AAC.4
MPATEHQQPRPDVGGQRDGAHRQPLAIDADGTDAGDSYRASHDIWHPVCQDHSETDGNGTGGTGTVRMCCKTKIIRLKCSSACCTQMILVSAAASFDWKGWWMRRNLAGSVRVSAGSEPRRSSRKGSLQTLRPSCARTCRFRRGSW